MKSVLNVVLKNHVNFADEFCYIILSEDFTGNIEVLKDDYGFIVKFYDYKRVSDIVERLNQSELANYTIDKIRG